MTQSHIPFTIDEMMQMFIHWDEHSHAMFTDAEYRHFLDCLNDLVAEFGRSWVEHLAGVRKAVDPTAAKVLGNDNVGDGARGIVRAAQFHEDWSIVKHCSNAKNLCAKLNKSYDNHHVDFEVQVAATFARCGAMVELEPELASGKVSDFRVKAEDGSWLYVEVSKRVFEIPKLERDIETLLKLCLEIAVGKACSLHILGKFKDKNFEKIEGWLAGLVGTNCSNAILDGLAEYRSFDHGHDGTTDILVSRSPPLQMKSDGDISSASFATIYYYAPDFGFADKFAEEREQLPSDGIGLIVIDVTGIAGSLSEWQEKASAKLSDPENSHILGVLLLAKGIDSTSSLRWRFDVSFASNSGLGQSVAVPMALVGQAFPAIFQPGLSLRLMRDH